MPVIDVCTTTQRSTLPYTLMHGGRFWRGGDSYCFDGKNILARRHLWYAAGPTLSCLPLRQARRERQGRRGRQNCSVKGYGFAEGVCGFCRGLPSVIFTASYEADLVTCTKQTGPFHDCLCAQSSTKPISMQVIYFTTAALSTNNFIATTQLQTL